MNIKPNYFSLFILTLCASCGGKSNLWEKNLITICEDKRITRNEFEDFRNSFKKNRYYSHENWCSGKGKIDSIAFVAYLQDKEGCIIEWAKNNPTPDYFEIKGYTEIPMKKEKGGYLVPVKVNDIGLNFIFDTGASVIAISQLELAVLIKNNTISKDDLLGYTEVVDATGNVSRVRKLNLKKVQLGERVLQNVEAVVIPNINADLLLGQTALSRFGRVEIDYNKQVIRLYDN
ncbi:MAG: retroviral-like aspartic protease family protein [Bacteroidia bacterium]|nr:retroviral-like aspartic protease family protein [Bacteroidia bacterium]MDW8348043.1 retropepsin-like aspartic protease [Bacteroidia bacterium]